MKNEFKKTFVTIKADKGSVDYTALKHGPWFYMEGTEWKMYPNPYIASAPIDTKLMNDILNINPGIGECKQYEIWIREVDHSA